MAGLASHLDRLWQLGLVLSRDRTIAEDLVQATCLRALERSHQFQAGTRLDRWLSSILLSIWMNQVRAARAARDRVLAAGGTPVDALRATVITLGAQAAEDRGLSRAVVSANIVNADLGGFDIVQGPVHLQRYVAGKL